jgi:hypothetical protein
MASFSSTSSSPLPEYNLLGSLKGSRRLQGVDIYERTIPIPRTGARLQTVIYQDDLIQASGIRISDDPRALVNINKMFNTVFTKNNAGKHILSTCANKMLYNYQNQHLFNPENEENRERIEAKLQEEANKYPNLNERKRRIRARKLVGENDYLMLIKLILSGGSGGEEEEHILGFMLFSFDPNYYAFIRETNNLSPINHNFIKIPDLNDPTNLSKDRVLDRGILMALYVTYRCSFATLPVIRSKIKAHLPDFNMGTHLWDELLEYTRQKGQIIKKQIYEKEKPTLSSPRGSIEEFYERYPFRFFIFNKSLSSAFMYHYNNGMRIIYSELLQFFYYIAKFTPKIPIGNKANNKVNNKANNKVNNNNNNSRSVVSNLTNNGNRNHKSAPDSIIDHLHPIKIYSIPPRDQVWCVERYIQYLMNKNGKMRTFSISGHEVAKVSKKSRPSGNNNGSSNWQAYKAYRRYRRYKEYKECNKKNDNNNDNNNSSAGSSTVDNVYDYGYSHIDEDRIKKFKLFTDIEDYLFLYYLHQV